MFFDSNNYRNSRKYVIDIFLNYVLRLTTEQRRKKFVKNTIY